MSGLWLSVNGMVTRAIPSEGDFEGLDRHFKSDLGARKDCQNSLMHDKNMQRCQVTAVMVDVLGWFTHRYR